MCVIREGVEGGEASWSKEGVSRRIDDGESTPFRCDP